MIHDGKVDLHNVAELFHDEQHGALRLQRTPETLREHINPGAQQRVLDPAGVEIRFVLEGDEASITLSAPNEPIEVDLFFGDFKGTERFLVNDTPTTLRITCSEETRSKLAVAGEHTRESRLFSHTVVRLRTMYHGPIFLHEVTGSMRPPVPSELPARTLLTYGTSITHGASASRSYLGWPAQTAWRLGTDLVNLGVGGSCHAEHEFADYIAARTDWDLAAFGLSVNMVGAGFTIEEFSERVTYLLRTVTSRHPGKPVFAISLFTYFGDWDSVALQNAKAQPAEFRKALETAVEDVASPSLHFVDGRSLLNPATGLTADMVHPSDLGMIQIAERLTARIREHI